MRAPVLRFARLSDALALTSLGVVGGALAGAAAALYDVLANGYLQAGTLRLAALAAWDAQVVWIPPGLLSGVALTLLAAAVWRLGEAGRRRPVLRLLAPVPRRKLVIVVVACLAVLVPAAWAVNQRLLPHKLHPVSLAADLLMVLLAAAVGAAFVRAPWSASARVLRRLGAVCLTAAVALFGALALDRRTTRPTGPNLLIVLSDTLRRDHLGHYGYRRDTSPQLDRLARESRVFLNAFAQAPSTKPSVASLFTSRYPSQHGTLYNRSSLSRRHFTLAEILRQRGYRTAGFYENPVVSEVFGFAQGFASWTADDRRYRATSQAMEPFDEAIDAWIERDARTPFFLYVHYIDPHSPYRAPAGFDRFFDPDYDGDVDGDLSPWADVTRFREDPRALEHLASLYDDEIRYVDSRFGRLIGTLRRLGRLDDTVVVFLSDHGEAFMEHGHLFHSQSVYAELIDIPLLVRYPGALPPGEDRRPVSHVDLLPTLLGLLDVDNGPAVPAGRDLLREVAAEQARDLVLVEHLRGHGWGRRQRALIRGPWKLVHSLDEDRFELFHRPSDPGDHRDLARDRADVARELIAELLRREATLEADHAAGTVDLDARTREKLRSLGYVR